MKNMGAFILFMSALLIVSGIVTITALNTQTLEAYMGSFFVAVLLLALIGTLAFVVAIYRSR